MIDMTSVVRPEDVGVPLSKEAAAAHYRIVLVRRRAIYEARQRGESMPWDTGHPAPLTEDEMKEMER